MITNKRKVTEIFVLASIIVFLSLMGSLQVSANELNENLIQNPGFEDMQDGVPAHWEAMNGWNNPEIDFSQEAARTGDVGIIIKTEQGTNPWIRQEVHGLEEGAIYEATANIKGVDFRHRGASIKMEFYSGEPGSDTWVDGVAKRLDSATGDWEEFTFTQQAPEGTKVAQIYYRLRPSGEIHFDDVSFKKIADRPQIELDTNLVFYYPDLTEGTVQADLYAANGGYSDQTVDVHISNKNTGEVIEEAIDLPAEQNFEYTFDPSQMALEEPYLVKVSYKDTNGEIIEAGETEIYKWERPTAMREDGTLIVDGEPFFPLIGYHVREHNYGNVGDTINTVQGWLTTDDDDRMERILDQAEAHGLKVLVPLYDNMQVRENFERIERKVTKFKDHPAVLGWMIMDEPTTNGIPLEDLIDAYKLIRSIDKKNPTYMVEASTNHIEEKSKATDIVAINPYPLPNRPITTSGDVAEIAMEAAQGVKPVYAILQAFQLPPNYPYLPTLGEIRHMAYQNLLEGVHGLGYYAYEDPGWSLVDSELYPGLIAFTEKELASFAELTFEGVKINQHKDDQVQWGLWELEGDLYVAILNLTEEAQTVNIPLNDEGYHVEKIAPDYVQSSLTGDQFTMDLSRLEAALVKLTPFSSSDEVLDLIEMFDQEGEFSNQTVRALTVHMTSISHYENQEAWDKVVNHLRGFKQLLEHYKQNDNLSENAYAGLMNATDDVIRKTMVTALHMTLQVEDRTITPGETIQLRAQFDNRSNENIEISTLTVNWPEELGSAERLENGLEMLEPGESVEFMFGLEVPESAALGDYFISSEVKFDYQETEMSYTREQYVTVVPLIEAKVNENFIDVQKHGEYPITLSVKNHSSTPIDVHVEADGVEGLELLMDSPIQIGNGETIELSGYVRIANELADGEYDMVIQVAVDGQSRAEIPITVLLDKNLIRNPGFEEETNSGGSPVHWSLRSGTWAQDEAYNGQYALKLLPDADNNWNVSTSAIISIEAGQAYRLSGWSRNESSTGGIEIGVREVDASGGTVTYYWQETAAHADWTNNEIEFVAGNQTDSVYVFMKIDQEADGAAWFDDFRLEEIPSTNLLQNSSFETLKNGNPEHWSATQQWNNHAIHVTTEEAYTGNHSLKISTETRDNYLATQTLDVEGGKAYEVSTWLKSEIEHGGKAQIKLEFYQDQLGGAGFVSDLNSEAYGSYEDWEQVKLEFDVPDDANLVRVYFRLFGPGTAYYDDVSFRKLEQ